MQVSNVSCALRALLVVAGLSLLALLSGCATDGDSDVGATHDPIVSFPATAMWVWDDPENKLPADDRIDPVELDRRLKAAIASEFAARGYSETGGDKVHYLLSYEVGIHTWMSQTEARAYGTLSVLMTEAATGRKVWLGFVRMLIDPSMTLAERDERLRTSIARMLENFPPAQRS